MIRGHRVRAPRPLSDAELELIEALLGAAGGAGGRYLGQLVKVRFRACAVAVAQALT